MDGSEKVTSEGSVKRPSAKGRQVGGKLRGRSPPGRRHAKDELHSRIALRTSVGAGPESRSSDDLPAVPLESMIDLPIVTSEPGRICRSGAACCSAWRRDT